jgi:hypothetical protein
MSPRRSVRQQLAAVCLSLKEEAAPGFVGGSWGARRGIAKPASRGPK